MTYSFPQLTAYQKKRREHRTQINDRLHQLYQEIQKRLEELRQQEEVSIKAEEEALKLFRSSIEADARCLLSTPELAAYAKVILAKSLSNQPDSPYSIHFDPAPRQWLLGKMLHPVQILEFKLDWEDIEDDDDEPPKTCWRYWLTSKIGDYQQKLCIPIAESVFDNSSTYQPLRLITQYYECRRKLKLDAKELEFTEPQLSLATQELSCLLVSVGSLFTIHNQTQHFCYPQPKWGW